MCAGQLERPNISASTIHSFWLPTYTSCYHLRADTCTLYNVHCILRNYWIQKNICNYSVIEELSSWKINLISRYRYIGRKKQWQLAMCQLKLTSKIPGFWSFRGHILISSIIFPKYSPYPSIALKKLFATQQSFYSCCVTLRFHKMTMVHNG